MAVSVGVYGLCLLSLAGLAQGVANIACYYGTWARYSGLKVQDIDYNLCTSILVSFVLVREDLINIVPYDAGDIDQVYPVFRQMRAAKNGELKIVIALGGATHDNTRFDRMIADNATLAQFAENTVLQLRQWGMDGLDVDWEFPSNKEIHRKFIQALRDAFDNEIPQPGNQKLELSGALPAGSHYIAKYDIEAVGRIMDIAYVMAYDYHGPWDFQTGHNSPLFGRFDDENPLFNTEWTINHWHQNGIPKSKLYVGVPTYGRTFILRDPTNFGVNVPADGDQLKTYGESCTQILSKPNAQKFWDFEAEASFAVKGSTWLTYASTASISNKCQWIDLNGFGGAMVWSLHQDDFANACGQGTFPLLRSLNYCSESFPTPPTPPTLPTTAPPPTTTGSGFCGDKADNTFHEIPGDCTSFIQCHNSIAYIQTCGTGLEFSGQCKCCEFPSRSGRTDCNTMPTSTPAPTVQTSATTTATPSTATTTATSSTATTTATSSTATTTATSSTATTTATPTSSPGTTTPPVIGEPLEKIACYYGTWARYSGLTPDMIDANLCTSILISFVKVRFDLIDIVPFESEDLTKVYPVLRNLKSISTSGLKLVIALGGASHDNSLFDRMIADGQKLRMFASNTVKTLRSWGMDGIDVDWEFPTDAAQHVTFLAAMRAAIDGEALEDGQERLELSAALSAGKYIPFYDIASVGSLLDIGYVMAYDYHGSWEEMTGHNSPLFPRQDDMNQNLNAEWSLNHWFLKGFPKHKLYVGVPTYARQFGLLSPAVTKVGAPSSGGQIKLYGDICSSFLKRGNTVEYWDSQSKVPYAVSGSEWMSYANISSVVAKCNWASANGFGGLMVWSLHQDDYDGVCEQGTFPLVRALKACSESFPTPPPLPTTTTPEPVVPSTFCVGKGENTFHKLENDCTRFIQCAGGTMYIQTCPPGLHFTESCSCCEFPLEADRTDCDNPTTTAAPSTTPSQTTPPPTTTTSATTSASTTSASTSASTTTASTPASTTTASTTTASTPASTTSASTTTASTTTASTTTTTSSTTSSTTTTSQATTTSTTETTTPLQPTPFQGNMEKIACYYGTWGRYSGLQPEAIDATLCTSVLVSFVEVTPDLTTIRPFDFDDIDSVYPVFINKKRQTGLKVIIALGGASHANERFHEMIADPFILDRFASNTVRQIRDWEMDGIDVDWEFPLYKDEHVIFLEAMRVAVDTEVLSAGQERLELSAALPAGFYIDNYDIPAVGQLLDIGYVMAYDYHGPWESMTGHNSPLSYRQDEQNKRLNAEWTINHWIDNGFPREKVYMGVPTYARTFRVADPIATGVGVGVRAFGQQTLTYRQVCNNILSKPTTRKFWDPESLVPYAVDEDIWVSYANGTSLAHKCYWADKNGLGGLMVWSLHQDDFDGSCDGSAFSLTSALKQCTGVLPAVPKPEPTPPPPPTPSTTSRPTTTMEPITGPVTETFCETRPGGYYEIPGVCDRFVRCVASVTHFFSCPLGLEFNLRCQCCLFPAESTRLDCNGGADLPLPDPVVTRPITTTPKPNQNFCHDKADGLYEVYGACSIYYTCSNQRTFHGRCDYPTLFNTACRCCDRIAQTLVLRNDCQV